MVNMQSTSAKSGKNKIAWRLFKDLENARKKTGSKNNKIKTSLINKSDIGILIVVKGVKITSRFHPYFPERFYILPVCGAMFFVRCPVYPPFCFCYRLAIGAFA